MSYNTPKGTSALIASEAADVLGLDTSKELKLISYGTNAVYLIDDVYIKVDLGNRNITDVQQRVEYTRFLRFFF